MTALVTDNLPLLAGAPNGIKKLRELILELAVRGKLLEQNSNDEPASELLTNIAKEKALLIENKTIRKGKPLPDIEQDEMQFKLPIGWEWVRLGQIGDWGAGATPARGNSSYYGGEMPWFKSGELIADFISDSEESVTELALKECSLRRNRPGDVLIAMYGATIGKTAILRVEGTTNQAVCACTPFNGVFNRYLLLTLKALKSNFIGQGAGGAQPNISREKIVATVTGLPPLAEQHRIVAKVDELMTLCDRLEAQQADAESAHAQLVQALLDSLTQASNAAELATNWQRLAEHFHTLFTTESSIDALKQTLVQLAVMGKLVPQRLNDEPAISLLQRNGIKSEPHALQGWAKLPLGHLGQIFGGSTPSKGNKEFWSGDIPWVSPKDMKRPLIHDSEDHISAKALAETSLKSIPPKSLLMVVRGMILAHSFPVALTVREVTINQDMKALVPPKELSDYLLMYLQAAKGEMVGLVDRSSHGTCKLISEKLWSHTVLLPPLAEQHRIVAKTDQLMTLCDQLKTRLTQSRQLNEQLASTLVEQVMA